jgi:hypothetical protein
MPRDIFVQISLAFRLVCRCLEPYNFRMALTAALVNGADVLCGAIVLGPLFSIAVSISDINSMIQTNTDPFRFGVSQCSNVWHDDEHQPQKTEIGKARQGGGPIPATVAQSIH